MKKNRKFAGFTLVELMIVVAIVAILATIAVPSYQNYVRKSKRADAKTSLLAMELSQEKLRANCPFYGQSLGGANSCGANAGATTVTGSATSLEGYYTIAISAGTASSVSYTATALGLGDQANDTGCTTLTLTVTAASGAVKTPTVCW